MSTNNILFNEQYEPLDSPSQENSEIISIIQNKDYSDTLFKVILSINNHAEDIPTEDDYPYFKEDLSIKFIPKLDSPSEILSERQLKEIHQSIPYYNRYKNMRLLYSATKHGTSMTTFYDRVKTDSVCILIIKDDSQHVFGGYLSEHIRNSEKFYGTGESFVFTFHQSEKIHCFEGSNENDYYIYSDNEVFGMGCSDNCFSILVRDDFLKGSSRYTKTFKNTVLSSNEEYFIEKIEFWGFDE